MESYENFKGLTESEKKKFFQLLGKITGISSRCNDTSETTEWETINKDQPPLPSVTNGTRSLVSSLSAASQLPNHEKKSPLKQKTLDKWIIKTNISSLKENAIKTSETQQPVSRNIPWNDLHDSSHPSSESEPVDCANATVENATLAHNVSKQNLETQEKYGTENERAQEQNIKQLNSGRKLVVRLERANIKNYLHEIKSAKNVDSMPEVSQISSSFQPTIPMYEERNVMTNLSQDKSASVLEVQKSISGDLSSVNSRLYNLRSIRHAFDPNKSPKSSTNEVFNPSDEKKADLKELSKTVSKETNKINALSVIPVAKQNQHSKKAISKNCNENTNLSSTPVCTIKVDAQVKDGVNESVSQTKKNWEMTIESVATNTISVMNTGCPIASEEINESVSHVGKNLEEIIEKLSSKNCNENTNLSPAPLNPKKLDAQVEDGVNESVSLARENWEMIVESVVPNTISVMNTGYSIASASHVGKNLEEVIESVAIDTKSAKEIDTVAHTTLKQDSEELHQLDKKTKIISASEDPVANPRKKLKKKSISKDRVPKIMTKEQGSLSKRTANEMSVGKDFGFGKDSLHTIEVLSEPGKKRKCKPKPTNIQLIPNDVATKESTETNDILTPLNAIPACVPDRKQRKKNLQSKKLSSGISPLIKVQVIESKSNSPTLERESNVKAMSELSEKSVVEPSALNKHSLKRKKGGQKNKDLCVSPSEASDTNLPQSAPLLFSPNSSEKEETLLSAKNFKADSKCIVSSYNKVQVIESKSNSPTLERESNVKAMSELSEKSVVEPSALNKHSLKRKKGGQKNKNLGVSPSEASDTNLPQSAPLLFSPDSSEKEETLLSAKNFKADSKCIVSSYNKVQVIESKSNSPTLERESNVKAMSELPEKSVVEPSVLNKHSLKRKKGGQKNKNLGVSPSEASDTNLPHSAPLVFSPDSSEKEETPLSAKNFKADSKCIVSSYNKDVSDIRPSRTRQCKKNSRSRSGSNKHNVELQNDCHSSSFNNSPNHKKKISDHLGSDELSIENPNPSPPIYQESSNAAIIVLSSQNLKSHSDSVLSLSNEKSQFSLSSSPTKRQCKRSTQSNSGSNQLSVELQNDCHSSPFNSSPLHKEKISDHSVYDELSFEKQNHSPPIYQKSNSAASIISSSQNLKPHSNDCVLSFSNENSQVPFLSSPCINKKRDTSKPESPNFELQNSVQSNFTKKSKSKGEVNFPPQVTGNTLEVTSNSDDNQNLKTSTRSRKKHISKPKNLNNELENLEITVITSSEKTVSSPQNDTELNHNKNSTNEDQIVLPITNDKISDQIGPPKTLSNLDSSTPPSVSKKHRNKIRCNFKSKISNKKLDNIVVTIYTDSNSSKENTISLTHNSLTTGDDCHNSNLSSPSLCRKEKKGSLNSSKEKTVSSKHNSLASDGDCHISDLSSPSPFKKERQDSLNTESPNIESQLSASSICAENSTSVETVSSPLNSNSNPLLVQTNNDDQNSTSSTNTYKNENQHFSKFNKLNDLKNLVVTFHTENNFNKEETVSTARNSASFRQIVMKSNNSDEIANSQTITDPMLKTDVAEPLSKNSGLTTRTRLRKGKKGSKVCEHAEFSSEKCSPNSTVHNSISESDVATSVELNVLNIDANAEPANLNANADSENLDVLNDIGRQLDSYITTEKNIAFMEEQYLAISEVQSLASGETDAINSVTIEDCGIEASDLLLPSAKKMQFNYEAYCEMSKLCNAIGVNLDELFQNPEVVNSIKTGSCEEIFIIRGHKLMMGNIVASVCKTDKEFRDILHEMQISTKEA